MPARMDFNQFTCAWSSALSLCGRGKVLHYYKSLISCLHCPVFIVLNKSYRRRPVSSNPEIVVRENGYLNRETCVSTQARMCDMWEHGQDLREPQNHVCTQVNTLLLAQQNKQILTLIRAMYCKSMETLTRLTVTATDGVVIVTTVPSFFWK